VLQAIPSIIPAHLPDEILTWQKPLLCCGLNCDANGMKVLMTPWGLPFKFTFLLLSLQSSCVSELALMKTSQVAPWIS
jgi:hypothetical protein